MGKINGCLKCLFIFFNVLFAILGGLMIIGAITSSAYSHQMSAVGSPVWSWLFAIGVLSISCLGVYAGYSEKETPLKTFAGLMVLGMIIMLIFGIITVVERNKIESSFDSTQSFRENEELRTMLNHLLEIAIGLYFGFAVTALLGLLISCLMIYQIQLHDGSGETSIAMSRY